MSSPMNSGRRPRNGGCLIKLANAGALVEGGGLDLDHRLAGQHLDRPVGIGCAGGRHGFAHDLGVLRRKPIVQRDREALVLQNDAVELARRRPRTGRADRRSIRMSNRCGSSAAVDAQLGAVAADGRKLQRREQLVELGERPPADKGGGAAGLLGERCQRPLEPVRAPRPQAASGAMSRRVPSTSSRIANFRRSISSISTCRARLLCTQSIRLTPEVPGNYGSRPQRARTSTSPSTPVTTRKVRS